MPRKTLTARFCDSVTVTTQTDYWDDLVRSLVLRVHVSGVKSWRLVYSRQSDGRKMAVTLGRYPAIDLECARRKAKKVIAKLADGADPAGDLQAQRAAPTFEELGRIYIEKYAKRNKKTWQEDERILKVEVYPVVGAMKAVMVRRRDLLDIIERKAGAGRIAQSTQILAVVRKMGNWAVENEYLETSPAAGIKPRGKPVKRDRVLSDTEIAEVWNALPEASLSSQTADIIRLAFLLGQRTGEICGMTRDEIDLAEATWTIPGRRTKNGLVHRVPLPSQALTIIRNAIGGEDQESDRPLFSKIGTAFDSTTIAKAVRRNPQLLKTRWTPHDARRSAASGMARIGIAPHIIEATLNHISGFKSGVAGVYNRHQYESEKKQALAAWAAHLCRVMSSNEAVVVPTPKATRSADQ